MKRTLSLTTLSLAACAWLALVPVQRGQAAVIFSEYFNTDGLDTRYSATGAGYGTGAFWELGASQGTGFTGFEGANFWGGQDLNSNFGGTSAIPRFLTVPLDPQPVTGFSDLQLSLSIAAVEGFWESGDADSIYIYAVNTDTNETQLLEAFLPDGTANADLVATINSATVLTSTFQDFTFDITLSDLDNLSILIEASSTGAAEVMGFDSLVVSGIPEPASASLLLGGTLLLALRRKRR